MSYSDFDKIAITILICALIYVLYNNKSNNDTASYYSFRPLPWAY